MMRCKLMDIHIYKSIQIAIAKQVRQLRIIAYAAQNNNKKKAENLLFVVIKTN